MARRSTLALLPVFTLGALLSVPTPASASTSSPATTQAAGTDPTVAALEAEVTAAVDEVLAVPLPLLGSVECIPYYVVGILSGDRLYPCV